MREQGWLTRLFEEHRPRLRGVAYRMLGSLSDAEDAVQEAWLRLHRIDPDSVDNLGGWLTTVVSRVSLDMLRSRRTRREEPLDATGAEPDTGPALDVNPEAEAMLADSVGVALLVVLETLTPAERLAFVLHDLFAMPFDEIAVIMGRSPDAAKQLASRARRRVRGSHELADASKARQREVVEAFITAARAGDLEGLLAILDPEAVLRIDGAARIAGGAADAADTPREIKGASLWARQMIAIAQRMTSIPGVVSFFQVALIDGNLGLVLAPRGKLSRVVMFNFSDDKITRVEAIGDRARLRRLEIVVP
jgi:RNA polymerase sigma-70 factor (ECF subfamily)